MSDTDTTEHTISREESVAVAEECDICGAELTVFNCELLCLNCGFRRDCSDP